MKSELLLAYGWGLGWVLLGAWPALLDPSEDSFPLSTYPMFSRHRGQPTFERIVGIERGGRERAIAPRLVANSETLQAMATISNAVKDGPEPARALCRQVASRVASDLELSDVRRLEIRSVRYDPIRYFTTSKEPLASRRVLGCRVRGGQR